jgi:hypothetical protein
MTMLEVCGGCGGFVPGAACPHCGRALRRTLARRLGAGALGGGALAFTLMACYGAPPYCDEKGGGCIGDEASASDASRDSRPDVHVGGGDAGSDAGDDAASDAGTD